MKTYLIATLAMAVSALAQPQKAETLSNEPSGIKAQADKRPIPRSAETRARAFDAMLYVSVQDPSMEWWFNVPEGFAPHISELKKSSTTRNSPSSRSRTTPKSGRGNSPYRTR